MLALSLFAEGCVFVCLFGVTGMPRMHACLFVYQVCHACMHVCLCNRYATHACMFVCVTGMARMHVWCSAAAPDALVPSFPFVVEEPCATRHLSWEDAGRNDPNLRGPSSCLLSRLPFHGPFMGLSCFIPT
jgi:hypothetical protein